MKLYDKIIVDALRFERHKHPYRNPVCWTFIGLSIFNLIILLAIEVYLAAILSRLGIYHIETFVFLDLFPGEYLDSGLSGLLTIGVIAAIINYYLVIHKKRYLGLFWKYRKWRINRRKGILYIWFFIVAISSFVIPLVILIIIDSVFG